MVLRYFNVFGPRQDPHSRYAAVVPRFIAAALNGQRPVIYGDGRQTRDFIYVGNVVHANLLALQAPAARVAGQVLNVGSGRGVSVLELWTRIRDLVGVACDPDYHAARAGEVRDSLACVDKAREVIGYEPTITLEIGLAQTVAACRVDPHALSALAGDGAAAGRARVMGSRRGPGSRAARLG